MLGKLQFPSELINFAS